MREKLISKQHAYEKHDGTSHVFEIFEKSAGAPYFILLDGCFLCTAENGPEIAEEVESTIRWFDWTRINPTFA